jgi:multidrug efflux pump subunit AcrB
MAVTDSDAPAARRPEMNEAVDLEEFCEQQEAQVAQQRPAGRSMKVAAVLLACMVGVALVAISGVDATARPQQETELLSKADDALQGGKLHAIAAALSQRNKVLEARRHTPGTGSVAAMMTAQAHAVQRSASKLAGVTHTMTRGHMLDEEPAAEEPAAEEPAAEEPAAAPEPEATPEGQIKDTSDEAMESEIGNLKPTGIMGVFFSGHTFIIAISIILSLIVAICCFARYADCALT